MFVLFNSLVMRAFSNNKWKPQNWQKTLDFSIDSNTVGRMFIWRKAKWRLPQQYIHLCFIKYPRVRHDCLSYLSPLKCHEQNLEVFWIGLFFVLALSLLQTLAIGQEMGSWESDYLDQQFRI